ncbi:HAD family hydrolase [uncultured Hymenobacter sp.]|uniref:HAD family hydrolase n=1 Tax=uncultured Hymenobacter sp. TaxID=170016 RepID=UPI0035CAED86
MSAPTAPTTILFDLDDTLFDHWATARAALAAALAERPELETGDFETLYRRHSALLEELHPQVLAGRYTPDAARQLRFRRLLAPHGAAGWSDEAVAGFALAQYGHYQRLRRPVAGAPALLAALNSSGCRVGIVTNNRTAVQQDTLAALDLDRWVEELVTSEAAGVAKPDPRIYHVALERLGCRPEQAVMVGDSWENDVVGALAAGIRPVWLNRFAAAGGPARGTHVAEITGLEPLAQVLAKIQGRG